MAKIIQFPGASHEDDNNQDNNNQDDMPDTAGNEAFHDQLSLEDIQILGPMGRSGPEYAALSALYGKSPKAAASTFEIDARMTLEDLDTVPVLARVCRLLELVRDAGRVKMTAAGYLPVSFVGRLAEQAYSETQQRSRGGGLRETDIRQLWFERTLAMHAGLLGRTNGYLKLTDRGEQLLSELDSSAQESSLQETRTGALNTMYEFLLHAALESSEALEESSLINHSQMISKAVLLFVFAIAGKQGELIYQEDLVDLLARLLPNEFRASIEDSLGDPVEMLEWNISYRFFNMCAVTFGLCIEKPREWQPENQRESLGDTIFAALPSAEQSYLKRSHGPWLVTDLFPRVFQFHREAPKECFLNDRQAALLLTDLAAGSTYEFYAKRYCVLAIERDPACAEAYVLLASIERGSPEQALRVLEAGISASEGRQPELPEGVPVWRDHMYRDILRLRFARAEALASLKRFAEAVSAYREILRLDAEDNIGVRHKLVPLLIVDNQVEEAEQLVEAFAVGVDEAESAFVRWNRTLIAYARGGAKLANPVLQAAMEANEYVVEEILYAEPFPDMMPDSYYIGSPEEAMVYAEESQAAWRKVKGVRAWLRRKVEG